MPTLPKHPLLLALALSLGTHAATAEPPSRPAALFQRLKALDRNGDGKLTRDEAGNAPWFDRLDADHDGVVTADEVRAAAAALARGGNPRSITTLPGEPAADAAPESPRVGPKLLRPAEAGVGRLVPDLAFTDIDGRPGKFSDFAREKALVIAFTSTSCPVTKKQAPALARLEREFADRGVAVLFVNPIASDTREDIRAAVRDHHLAGRYVHDRDGRITATLGARTTAEMFVLDAARTLVFRGALDDQYGLGYSLDAPRRTFLKDALLAALAGRVPAIAATDAPGCALESLAGGTQPVATEITYHNRISRILQANCIECHHAGGVGPFSLTSYEDVRAHAGMMRKQVSRGAMPPWFAAPPPAGESSHWRNDRSLSAADKADLLTWLAGDKPPGNAADAPLPRVFPHGWAIGTPDAVFALPSAVPVKSEGIMPYQTLTVTTAFTEDKWVQAYEVQPTARDVVHHVIVRVHPKGAPVSDRDPAGSERDGFFAAYVPGNSHTIFPAGFAKKLPAGATLTFQMHYTPNGKPATDQTKIGLVFAAEPPRHVIQVAGISNVRFRIPPGADNHEETAVVTLPYEATLLGLMPHMHVRGKAARYEAILPDGTRKLLLDVPRYDFNWQMPCEFADPPTLPRGTQLVYTAWYDNSAANPANPDPTKLVRWGPQTFDEMMLGYVEYYLPGPRTAPRRAAE